MGHNTLGVIPRTVKWKRVINLLEEDGNAGDIIAASAEAAEKHLLGASDDPVYVEAVRLLLMIPAAARSYNFADALRKNDLPIAKQPQLLDLLVAATSRLDEVKRSTNRRTDLGELAGRALSETLNQMIGEALPGLFDATTDDVQAIARKLSYSKGISALTRAFIANITRATLAYYLERALANYTVDPDRSSIAINRTGFENELAAYTHEATRIIQEFSGGWYAKTLYERGEIITADAARFGAVCLKKVVEELRLRRAEYA
ncbi:hypothetical protein N4R57_11965 [Rhodobacteraceae bacterium D3-12]|nr:hypothetical protein N4R57_11965 [Rhodobacteraceae bacterium D3-12]